MRSDRSLIASDDSPTRSLVAVIAILTFLSTLTVGLAATAVGQALGWRDALLSEATVQVRPRDGRDLAADVERVVALARTTPGIASAVALPARDARELLEPWLGPGIDLSALPVPRLVALRLGPAPDLTGLRGRLDAEVPGSGLDDHGRWLSRLSWGAVALAGGAIGFALLLGAASAFAAAFAARGLAAANRRTIEILLLVGADDRFIARAVARRFLALGGAGAAIGIGGAATLLAVGDTGLAGLGVDGVLHGGVTVAAAMAVAATGVAGLASLASLRAAKGFVDLSMVGPAGSGPPRGRPIRSLRIGGGRGGVVEGRDR